LPGSARPPSMAGMRKILGALTLLLCLAASAAHAQLPQTLPANTVVGRLGIGPGAGQAIPFASFFPMVNAGLLSGNNTWTGTNTWQGSSTFVGIPTIPTAAPGTGTTQAASTAFVAAAVAAATSATNGPLDVFLFAGQSNAQGNSVDGSLSPLVPTGKVLQFSGTLVSFIITGGTITDANDPVGPAIGGSAWPAFGNAYHAATGRAILFVPSAVGGTDQCATTGVSTAHWDIGGLLAPAAVTNLTNAMAAARAAGYAPIYRGILWSQGENDAGAIGNNAAFPVNGSTTVTGGPYTAGTTVVTVASATGVSTNEVAVITLDNGTTYSTLITNVAGTTVTLQTGVPVGRQILTGANFHIYSMGDYRACFQAMLNYFRTTTTDGTTFPRLPFYISQTGGPQAGDTLGYQKVRMVQDQIAQSDPYTRVVFRGAVDFITRAMMQTATLHYTQEGYNEMGRMMARNVVSAQAGDQLAHPNETVQRITLGGTLRTGDQLTTVITSTGIPGSPVTIGPAGVLGGDTFAIFAARVAATINLFGPGLNSVGIYATSRAITGGAVIEIRQPETLFPQAQVTATWITGGATETASVSTTVSATSSAPLQESAALPWIPYAPVLTCGAGTLTTASATGKYRVLGKTVFFEANISITTNGTCAGAIVATLPKPTLNAISVSGVDASASKSLATLANAVTSTVSLFLYDGTYPGVNAHSYFVSGAYEQIPGF
jgi:carbohydrate esterase-like sialic acid-specific acetylesterase